MKDILIDASLFTDRAKVHEILKTALESANYLGNNLDALHDALTSITVDTRIILRNLYHSRKHLGGYTETIAEVFAASAAANPHLTVVLETVI